MILDSLNFQEGDEFYLWENSARTRLIYKIEKDKKMFYMDVRRNDFWQASRYKVSDISDDLYFLDQKFKQIPICEIVLMDRVSDFLKVEM